VSEDKETKWEQNMKHERKNKWQVDWLAMWMWYWSVGVCVCCIRRPDMIYMGYLSGGKKKVNETWATVDRHQELHMRTDKEQIWESWWLVMLMWCWHVGLYVFMMGVTCQIQTNFHANDSQARTTCDVHKQRSWASCSFKHPRQTNNDVHYS